MDDTAHMLLGEQREITGFRLSDLTQASDPLPSRESSVSSRAAHNPKNVAHADSSSDEDVTPFERAKRKTVGVNKDAKPKAKLSPGGALASGGGGLGAGGGADVVKNAGMVLVEVEKDLAELQQCGAMAEIKEEALSSLVGRLNAKKVRLAKRAGKDKSEET